MAGAMEHVAKRQRFDFSDETKVIIGTGSEEKVFTVPTCLLVETSKFFRTAVNEKRVGETAETTIKLPQQGCALFSCYLHWIYKKEIAPTPDNHHTAYHLIKFCILAQQLQDTALYNAVIDEILAGYNADMLEFNPDCLKHVWQNTALTCSIRALLLDVFAFETKPEYVARCYGVFPKDFIKDLLLTCMRGAQTPKVKPRFARLPKCHYHEHSEGHPKCP